jgi:hypothetical protein
MNLNELELWHRRHEELLQEAENERFTRRQRTGRSQLFSPTESGRRMARLHEAIASWGRTSAPFFRA